MPSPSKSSSMLNAQVIPLAIRGNIVPAEIKQRIVKTAFPGKVSLMTYMGILGAKAILPYRPLYEIPSPTDSPIVTVDLRSLGAAILHETEYSGLNSLLHGLVRGRSHFSSNSKWTLIYHVPFDFASKYIECCKGMIAECIFETRWGVWTDKSRLGVFPSMMLDPGYSNERMSEEEPIGVAFIIDPKVSFKGYGISLDIQGGSQFESYRVGRVDEKQLRQQREYLRIKARNYGDEFRREFEAKFNIRNGEPPANPSQHKALEETMERRKAKSSSESIADTVRRRKNEAFGQFGRNLERDFFDRESAEQVVYDKLDAAVLGRISRMILKPTVLFRRVWRHYARRIHHWQHARDPLRVTDKPCWICDRKHRRWEIENGIGK